MTTAPATFAPALTLDAAEFLALYRDHAAALRAYALGFTRDPHAAADLLQDAALRMWVKRTQFRAGTNFRAWGRRIVYTCFAQSFRTQRREARRRERGAAQGGWWAAGGDPPRNDGPARLGRAELDAELARLPASAREAFELRMAGYAYAEIAERLGVPVGTAKSRVFDARRALRRAFTAAPPAR